MDSFYLFLGLCRIWLFGGETNLSQGTLATPLRSKTMEAFQGTVGRWGWGEFEVYDISQEPFLLVVRWFLKGKFFLKSSGVQIRVAFHYDEFQSWSADQPHLSSAPQTPAPPSFHPLGNIRISENECLKVFVAIVHTWLAHSSHRRCSNGHHPNDRTSSFFCLRSRPYFPLITENSIQIPFSFSLLLWPVLYKFTKISIQILLKLILLRHWQWTKH